MSNTLYVTIWDDDVERIESITKNLYEAAKPFGCAMRISSMSEPPLLARMQFTGKTPVLEIGGIYWQLRSGEVPNLESCKKLLEKFFAAI